MMINQVIRYVTIVDILRKHGYKNKKVKILEVGSGSNGLGEYIQFNIIGCDIKFERNVGSNLLPVIGSAGYLPFKSNSFDVVISSDMLGHIKKQKRAKVIDELIRVAKSEVIIGCPCDKKSEDYDRKIVSWYRFIGKKYPNWLLEHIENGSPSETEIIDILNNEKEVTYYIVGNENVFVRIVIIILESIPIIGGMPNRLARLFSTRKFDWAIKLLSFGAPYRKIFVISKKRRNHDE